VRGRRHAGGRRRRARQHVPHFQCHHGCGVHHQGPDRRDHGRRRQSHGRPGGRPAPGHYRDLRGAADRSRPDARGQLRSVPRRSPVPAHRPVRERPPLSRGMGWWIVSAAIVAVVATVPSFANSYQVALGISLLSFIVLATAWALFSGPTRYISLATVAFFGIGAYTVGAFGDELAWPLVLALAALIGIVVALIVGLSTLRLSGMYFVIFTFGLS